MAAPAGKLFQLTLLCLATALQINLVRSKLSDYTTVCSAKDPDLNDCAKKSATEFIGKAVKGLPELGIPILDPFFVPMLDIDQKNMQFNVAFINNTVYGLSQMNITNVSVEPKKYKFDVEYYLPKQTFISTYRIKGKIMSLPISDQGTSNITFEDVFVKWKISGEPEIRDGVTYMKLMLMSPRVEPSRVHVKLNNLFNGNEMLGHIVNDNLNRFWKDIYVLVRPSFEKTSSTLAFNAVEHFFSHTPYNEMFHDI